MKYLLMTKILITQDTENPDTPVMFKSARPNRNAEMYVGSNFRFRIVYACHLAFGPHEFLFEINDHVIEFRF